MLKKDNNSKRKLDHIDLAPKAQVNTIDQRFYYEPLNDFVDKLIYEDTIFDGRVSGPLWLSSMTGGLELGRTINVNLAKVARAFGLGMGLGSCRALIDSRDRIEDFAMRQYIGDQPLFANLGIAQVEALRTANRGQRILDIVRMLDADGLIVHLNPLQEFVQPEGDPLVSSPIETIHWLLDLVPFDVIVKEVGQGMGPRSLKQLMKLPLRAIDTASSGGTNFALLEMMRSTPLEAEALKALAHVGHNPVEMIDQINSILENAEEDFCCTHFIISGGVGNFLDGYYYLGKINAPAMYGQASAILRYAKESYEQLYEFVKLQMEGFKLAQQLLVLKK